MNKITNKPRPKAVALKYDVEKMAAPELIAKGIGKTADEMVNIAKENDIAVVEDAGLTAVLFSLRQGDMVPDALYQPVAKILAYIILHKQQEGTLQ